MLVENYCIRGNMSHAAVLVPVSSSCSGNNSMFHSVRVKIMLGIN